MRSADEWEMSRSCQSGMFSRPTSAAARTTLDRALTGAGEAAPEFRPLLEEYRAAGFPDDGWVPDGV